MSNKVAVSEFKNKVKGNNPFFAKFIVNLGLKTDEMLSELYMSETYEKIIKYKQVIKNKKVNIFEFDNFDELNDELDTLIFNQENKKFINQFLSNKYKELMTKKSYELFALLRENEVDLSLINERFISSIAALKDTKSFNFQLEKFTNEVINFSNDQTIAIINENNAENVFIDDQYLAVLIGDFAASQALGSSRWCISRDESAFNNYKVASSNYEFREYASILAKYNLENINSNRYIYLYDFSKSSHSPDYLIGYTLSPQGKVLHQFDANNRVYSKNCHVKLLEEIQLNYLSHLNKEQNEKFNLDTLLKEVTNFDDKIKICAEFQPGKLVELYKNNNRSFHTYNKIKVVDEETFDYFLTTSEEKTKGTSFWDAPFLKTKNSSNDNNNRFSITTSKFFSVFEFINDNLKLKCINKINVSDIELSQIVESAVLRDDSSYRYGYHRTNEERDAPIRNANFILENFKLKFKETKTITSLFRHNQFISEKAFYNTDIILNDSIIDTAISVLSHEYNVESILLGVSKILKYEGHFSKAQIKALKALTSQNNLIKSLIDKNFNFHENLYKYMNLSKAIKLLSEKFMVDQIKYLKEKRTNEGVRFYQYNRPFFEVLMDNWQSANINRFKTENSEKVVLLLLNHHVSDDYLPILEWIKSKKSTLLNKILLSNNNIFGKINSKKVLIDFFNYDPKLLIPNVNQLSYLSLLSKNGKHDMLNKIKETGIYDKSTLHNAINGVFSLNGDQELLDLFGSMFNIDSRKPSEIFKDMLLNNDKHTDEERLDFIETYHTELRNLLKNQNENSFLKQIAKYL